MTFTKSSNKLYLGILWHRNLNSTQSLFERRNDKNVFILFESNIVTICHAFVASHNFAGTGLFTNWVKTSSICWKCQSFWYFINFRILQQLVRRDHTLQPRARDGDPRAESEGKFCNIGIPATINLFVLSKRNTCIFPFYPSDIFIIRYNDILDSLFFSPN